MLQRLCESGVSCYIGRVFTGALAYADDVHVVLIAPTSNAMRIMLKICERFADEFSVIFNASKFMCMLVSKYGFSRSRIMASVNEVPFCLDGNVLPFVEKCCHLGHMLSSWLEDKYDILSRRASMCGKVNNVLCYFNKCDLWSGSS